MTGTVVVTGYGVITPFGRGVEPLMASLRAGESAVRSMAAEWKDLVVGNACLLAAPVTEALDVASIPRKQRRCMSRGGILAQLATYDALARSGITERQLESGRLGAAFGDTMPSPEGLEAFFPTT